MNKPGYNEADTRAKLIDPALHARQWIELVKEEQRDTHGEIHRVQSAVRIEILDGKPIKRGRGRVDYLLRAFAAEHEFPLTLAFVEAKKEKLPPTQGLEQVKEYARRHAVKFVYSTNGHQFVEYDVISGKTTDPRPLAVVNPREKKIVDTRTPLQLLDAIAKKGREVDAALDKLRAML